MIHTPLSNGPRESHLAKRHHRVLLESEVLASAARLARVDGVQHLIVGTMRNADALLAGLEARSRDFR